MTSLEQIKPSVPLSFPLNTQPNDAGLWSGIAGNHNNIAQIIEEFVDNVLSNLRRHSNKLNLGRTVEIFIEKISTAKAHVSITDAGTGILDLENALTLAGSKSKETVLNEHGFGLKHALASADIDNNSWSIITRTTADAANNSFRAVTAPYSTAVGAMHGERHSGNAGLKSPTGTIISFDCPLRLFSALYKHSLRTKDFEQCIHALAEELRFTYSPIIASGELSIRLIATDGDKHTDVFLEALEPVWDQDSFKQMPTFKADFGGGQVEVACCYGMIHSSKNNLKYYKCNMSSSGVELRINGRAIAHGQLARIWGISLHPSQNRFCAVIDLRSEDASALPSTKSAKNGLREDDERTEALYSWIRSNISLPKKWRSQEAHLLDKLAEVHRANQGVMRVEREAPASRTLPLKGRIDLFVSGADGVTIYEAKVRRTKEDHVYQLRRYWDTAVAEGIYVDAGILVACSHPEEVRCMVDFVNKLTDPAGRHYNLQLRTWRQEGIPFDENVESAYSI